MEAHELPRHTNGPKGERVATVHNNRPAPVGSVSFSGRVFNVSGEHVGTVGLDGRVVTPSGTVVGWATPSGHIADFRQVTLSQVQANGSIVNRAGHYIGRVVRQRDVSVQHAAGAALLLLPVEGMG